MARPWSIGAEHEVGGMAGTACGQQDPNQWSRSTDYDPDAIVDGLASLYHQHCLSLYHDHDSTCPHKVVLAGHSLGGMYAVMLAHRLLCQTSGANEAAPTGVILLSPAVLPLRRTPWYQRAILRYLLPTPLLDLYRWYDRRGGTASRSVRRYLHARGWDDDAPPRGLAYLQFGWNAWTPSPVLKAVLLGLMDSDVGARQPAWYAAARRARLPVLLLAGAEDRVTPVARYEATVFPWCQMGRDTDMAPLDVQVRVFDCVAHQVHWEEKEACRSIIQTFLASLLAD